MKVYRTQAGEGVRFDHDLKPGQGQFFGQATNGQIQAAGSQRRRGNELTDVHAYFPARARSYRGA